MQKIISTMDEFTPLQTKTIYPKQQQLNPWMTSGLMKSYKSLDKLFKKQKTHSDYQTFIEYRKKNEKNYQESVLHRPTQSI